MPLLLLTRITQHRIYNYFSNHGCEIDYVVGVILNDLTNRIKKNTTLIHLSARGQTAVIVWWNYLDSFYNLMQALQQVLDKTNYRYQQNYLKAFINVFCATQMYLLTYFPALTKALHLPAPTSLAGVSFAVGTVGDLIAAIMDYVNACKDTVFEGWLDEKLKAFHYAHQNAYETRSLLKEIRARCKVFFHYYPGKKVYLEQLIHQRTVDDSEKAIQSSVLEDLDNLQTKHIVRNHELQNEAMQSYRTNRRVLAIKACSLVGMTLLATAGLLDNTADDAFIIVLTIGLALTTLVASYYVVVNSERMADAAGDCFRFFAGKQEEVEPVCVQTEFDYPKS